jgi:predicted transcriptional regulator
MATATVRIAEATRKKLRELAAEENQPMHVILEKAIEFYRRKRFLEEANAAFAALRSDPEAWKSELEERAAWDQTLADGLHDD